MGKKIVKVGVGITKSEKVTASAWTNNGGSLSTLTPTLRKILTAICIAQMVMIAVTAATLGAFVSSNVKEIHVLKQTTENMQQKINFLEAKQCATLNQKNNETEYQNTCEEIEATVTGTGLLGLAHNITELKAETTSNNSTIQGMNTRLRQLELDIVGIGDGIQVSKNITELKNEIVIHEDKIMDHEIRLTQMELSMLNCTSDVTTVQLYDKRIRQLEADNIHINNDIQALDATVAKIEFSMTEEQENTQALNMTVAQMLLDIKSSEDNFSTVQTRVEQLMLERQLDLVTIQSLNDSIMNLEYYREMNQVNIADLERNSTQFRADINVVNTVISRIESDGAVNRALTTALNTSVTELQVIFNSQTKTMNEQNRSFTQIRETVEMNSLTIQNISGRLAVFDTERRTVVAAIDANSDELLQLGHDINATRGLHHELEAKMWGMEDILENNGTSLSVHCTDTATGPSDNGGGNMIYLDRLAVDCGSDFLSYFQLNRPNETEIQYLYRCCTIELTNG